MKRVLHIHQRYILTGVLLALCLNIVAQNRTAFTSRAQENRSQRIRTTLTSSDTITLDGMGTIYSLSIDATISQPREASFTRIVLEDTDGHDYLVAESDWFRNDTTTVHLDRYCEETALLEGIIPLRLKCYLAGDAAMTLNGIYISNQPPTRKPGEDAETGQSVKEVQVKDIVDRINTYNQKHRKHWKAEITGRALKNFGTRVAEGIQGAGDDAYTNNILFYGSGIYEFGKPNKVSDSPRSQYPDTIDWRNRHGKNWITPCRNQGNSSWCSIFSAVAVVEAYVNLYYNRILNWDLSETYLAKSLNLGFNNATIPGIAIQRVASNGIIDEASLPFINDSNYINQITPEELPTGDISVKISGSSSYEINNGIEGLKRILIQKGPVISGFHAGGHQHVMLCVGYGKITPNSIYYIIHNDSVDNEEVPILEGDSLIGMDCWYFKDSYFGEENHGHNGYMYAVFHDDQYMYPYAYYPTGIVRSNIFNYRDVICEDKDNDGYFFWGIYPNGKYNHLPAWAPLQEDGDDSDCSKGPRLDDFGTLQELSLEDDTLYITHTDTICVDDYIRKSINVSSSGKLYLSAALYCYPGVKLTLESGAVLEIDGGRLDNIILDARTGSSIIIKNGGQLIGNKKYGDITIPIGVNLDISEGEIKTKDF